MSKLINHSLKAASVVLSCFVASACNAAPDAEMEGPGETAVISQTAPNEVEVIVLGQGRYLVDGSREPTLDVELEATLRDVAASREPAPASVILYVHEQVDESARGYSSTVALNAAARAGYSSARAVNNYSSDASPAVRATWEALPEVDLAERRLELARAGVASDTVAR